MNDILAMTTCGDGFVLVLLFLAVGAYFVSKKLSNPIDIPEAYWHIVPQASSEQRTARDEKARSRNIQLAFNQRRLSMVIFWGSQSGRGEVLAKRLAKSLEDRFGLRTLVADLDDYDHTQLTKLNSNQICGFVLSTYGDGDPTDNTNAFWKEVSAIAKDRKDLSRMRYILFGLGNSQYRQFNKVAETIDSIFQSRGAIRIGVAGRGDDAKGTTEDDFLTWRWSIEEDLKRTMQLSELDQGYQPTFNVKEMVEVPTDSVYLGEPHASLLGERLVGRLAVDADVPSAIPIIRSKTLWTTVDRLCLHLDLDLGENRFVKYKTGDHFACWPSNPDHEVDKLLTILGLESERDVVIQVESENERVRTSIPMPTTIETLFRYYLEISGVLSRDFLSALLTFAPTDEAKIELKRLSEDTEAFKRDVNDRKLTLADLLTSTSNNVTWRIPYSFMLERINMLRPRYYSICSPASVQARILSITVVIDKPMEPSYRGCPGLATSYFHALDQRMNGSPHSPISYDFAGPRNHLSGNKIYGRVRKSMFKLPSKASSPVIMIGCGTGVAPFRAFVQERVRQKAIGLDIGSTLLFMGFRHPDVDYIYEDEWRSAQNTLGTDCFRIYTGFSREDPEKKTYVQDRLEENAGAVLDLLERFGTRMYICGSAAMARDVASRLAQMWSKTRHKNLDQATAWVKSLRQSKSLYEDVWD